MDVIVVLIKRSNAPLGVFGAFISLEKAYEKALEDRDKQSPRPSYLFFRITLGDSYPEGASRSTNL